MEGRGRWGWTAIRVETTRGRRDYVPPTGAGWERVYLWMDAAAAASSTGTALWQGAHGWNPAAQSVQFLGRGNPLQSPLKCRKNSQRIKKRRGLAGGKVSAARHYSI